MLRPYKLFTIEGVLPSSKIPAEQRKFKLTQYFIKFYNLRVLPTMVLPVTAFTRSLTKTAKP